MRFWQHTGPKKNPEIQAYYHGWHTSTVCRRHGEEQQHQDYVWQICLHTFIQWGCREDRVYTDRDWQKEWILLSGGHLHGHFLRRSGVWLGDPSRFSKENTKEIKTRETNFRVEHWFPIAKNHRSHRKRFLRPADFQYEDVSHSARKVHTASDDA